MVMEFVSITSLSVSFYDNYHEISLSLNFFWAENEVGKILYVLKIN